MRSFFKWTGRVLGGVVVLVLLAAGAVYAMSERGMRKHFDVEAHRLDVSDDPAAIAQGQRLVQARGCIDCHGDRLTGRTIVDDPAVGRLAGPNLTRGGRGAELTDADWERAVRHGVRRDGSPLVVMPSQEYNSMSDADLAAIVAFARSLPADAAPSVPLRVGPMARVLYLADQIGLLPAEKIDHAKTHFASVAAEPTVAFGRYMAEGGCVGCHGAGYAGGRIPGTPPDWKPSANITPTGIGRWSEADFIRALRTGRRPDGTMIDTTVMPVRMTKMMTDVELQAVYRFLQTVPPKTTGTR
ncbi:MAG TPA: c-type cytochrome [Gemmatimonadaceae bacterium]|nr:c-type cytochrome [Gemmatimonadaceae bacterium]